MRLFDQRERTDTSPSPESEDLFAFLNRSARPDVENIRRELERWFETYPDEHQAELASHFHSALQHQHEAAWWELYLYRLFGLLGFDVEVHPTLDGVRSHPDFLITAGQTAFLLEATTTHAGIVNPNANATREGWIIDALNSAPHHSFMVGLRFEQRGAEKPRTNQVVGPVTAWLDGLDADGLLAANKFPVQSFECRGFRFQLRALPKAGDRRGIKEHEPLIGIRSGGAGPVDDTSRLLGKLRDKSGKYGDPGLPIVLAVNLLSSTGDDAGETALFGTLAVRVAIHGPAEERLVRNQDGFWMRQGEPLGTRVSCVLEGIAINPWSVATTWPRLWRNPWAVRPLDLKAPFPEGIGDQTGRVEYVAASSAPADLLGLPEKWPGGQI